MAAAWGLRCRKNGVIRVATGHFTATVGYEDFLIGVMMSKMRTSGLGIRIAAGLLLAFSLQTANAASLSVVNGSFEDPVVTAVPGFVASSAGPFCYPTICSSIPGWSFAGLGGLFSPNAGVMPPAMVDGAQVYFGDGLGSGAGVATQMLSATYQAATTYQLTVAIGTRTDISFGDGRIALFAGGNPANVVATLDLSTIAAPSIGSFMDVSLTASALQLIDAGAVGQSIGILIGGTTAAGQSLFDNVRVTAVPEPGVYMMMLAGLGLLGLRRRQRGLV